MGTSISGRTSESGDDGAPDRGQRRLWRPRGGFFFPARFSEAAALQVGVCDHGHQRVTMEAGPGAPLEVIEAEFFLELLVRLFANLLQPWSWWRAS